jgi:hypothetical protein
LASIGSLATVATGSDEVAVSARRLLATSALLLVTAHTLVDENPLWTLLPCTAGPPSVSGISVW